MENLREIARAGKERRVRKGDFFFRKGDYLAQLYVLIEGRVDLLFAMRRGRQAFFRTVQTFDHFGDVAFFGGPPHMLSARVREESRAIAWDVQTMAGLMVDYPDIARNGLNSLREVFEDVRSMQETLSRPRRRTRVARRTTPRTRALLRT